MNKEQRDLAWRCLPKEVREDIKIQYNEESTDHWDAGFDACLRHYFGFDNLTSDTEQEEVLMVSATKVQGFYEIARTANRNKEYAQGIADVLFSLFGDKCLTDEESETKSKEAKEMQNLSLSDEQSTESKEPIYDAHEDIPEPYTEPISQNPAGNCDSENLNSNCDNIWESRNLSKEIANCDKPEDKDLNYKVLYNALCELESASTNVRKVLISI